MPVASGSGSADADALVDGSMISVGVGTGGRPPRDGSGDSVGRDGGPGVALGGGAAAVVGTGEDSTADGVGTAAVAPYPTAVTGRDSAGFTGAAPIPPSPPTRPSPAVDAGALVGVPRVQPIVTASGRPNATMPKKRDLGERRTPHEPGDPPEGYGTIGV